jgi:hypothetical protein
MAGYKTPNLQQRQSDAAAAKSARLASFREAAADPARTERAVVRGALHNARSARLASKKVEQAEGESRLAEVAAQAKRDAEAAEAETAQREVALAAEQKAVRDARYAARKAAKKERRRG